MKTLGRIVLIILSIAIASSASAQSRRVGNFCSDNRQHRQARAYVSEVVDEEPQFPGGESALIQFINSTRQYPAEAYRRGIQGRVVCSFIVTPTGDLTNVEVIRGVTSDLNNEAIRIIKSMPRWVPGKIDDERVPVYYVLAIPFRL